MQATPMREQIRRSRRLNRWHWLTTPRSASPSTPATPPTPGKTWHRLRALGGLVKHVHLRDAIGQNILVVPGDGTVNFAALACALDEIGYGRAAVIELEYEDATAAEVRPDLARPKELLAKDFAVA